MKKINLTFALLIQAILTFSQTYTQGCASIEKSNVLDHAKYRITYCLKFKYSNNDKEYNQDTRIVQIGTKVVKDYSDRLLHYDTLATSNFKKGRPTPHLSDAVFPYEIINHYSSQGTLVNYRMFFQLGTLRYLEQFVKQNWSLTNGTTITILDHKCHKATLTFGQRVYTAWYAPDIPIHYGPYKFGLLQICRMWTNRYMTIYIAVLKRLIVKKLVQQLKDSLNPQMLYSMQQV